MSMCYIWLGYAGPSSLARPAHLPPSSPSSFRSRIDTSPSRTVSFEGERPPARTSYSPHTVRHASPIAGPSTGTPTREHVYEDDHTKERGRKGSRFSFAHVIDAVKERVHSNSPLSAHPHGVDMYSTSQGRMGDRGKEREGHHSWLHHAHGNTKEKPAFSRDVLGREEEHKEFGDGWQEFRKGVILRSLLTRVCYVPLPHKLT